MAWHGAMMSALPSGRESRPSRPFLRLFESNAVSSVRATIALMTSVRERERRPTRSQQRREERLHLQPPALKLEVYSRKDFCFREAEHSTESTCNGMTAHAGFDRKSRPTRHFR